MRNTTRNNIKQGAWWLAFLGSVALMSLWWGALAAQAHQDKGEWHTWEVQGDYGPNWDQNYAQAFDQPQVHLGEGQLTPACETWAQVDFYPYAAQKHGKSIADVIADGLLHDGEDHHLTGHKDGKWYFTYGGPCIDDTPDLIVPVAPPFADATCDRDGSFTLPDGPAAQNHDGETLWGVELDGYDFYVRNTTGEFGGPGVYAWEAYGKKGTLDNDGSGRYPSRDFDEHLYFTVPAASGDCDVPDAEPSPEPSPEPESSVTPEPEVERSWGASSEGPVFADEPTATECLPTEGRNARGECVEPTFTG